MAKKFSDFATEEKPLEGEKIKISEVLDKRILVKGFRVGESKFPNSSGCLTLQIEFNNQDRVLFTGSKVLMAQIDKYGSEIPFETVISKPKGRKYYTFT